MPKRGKRTECICPICEKKFTLHPSVLAQRMKKAKNKLALTCSRKCGTIQRTEHNHDNKKIYRKAH